MRFVPFLQEAWQAHEDPSSIVLWERVADVIVAVLFRDNRDRRVRVQLPPL